MCSLTRAVTWRSRDWTGRTPCYAVRAEYATGGRIQRQIDRSFRLEAGSERHSDDRRLDAVLELATAVLALIPTSDALVAESADRAC